jgi:hypothetical protein
MPEITESTPRTNITIAGETFTAPQPYAEGHVLSGNEATALNQTYAENLRNNFASKVKAAQEAGTFDLEQFQSEFDEYASGYEFGVRSGGGGGRSGNPVLVEAMNIARELVRKAIVKKGLKLADYKAADISARAKAALDKGDATSESIMALAKQRVEAAKEITDIVLDSDEA